MSNQETHPPHSDLIEEFQRHEPHGDAGHVVAELDQGFSLLCDLFYRRLHEDVERLVGRDSMWVPLSERKTQRQTKAEIEIYQCVESTQIVGDRRYLSSDRSWYLQWLLRFRLPKWPGAAHRSATYVCLSSEARRLEFSNVLSDVLAESRQAPLVLFRLFPLAVAVVTSVAFGDPGSAQEARNCQKEHLPAIGDCQVCRGAVLKNGESCPECGNPVWKYAWLTTD